MRGALVGDDFDGAERFFAHVVADGGGEEGGDLAREEAQLVKVEEGLEGFICRNGAIGVLASAVAAEDGDRDDGGEDEHGGSAIGRGSEAVGEAVEQVGQEGVREVGCRPRSCARWP